jgi:hypothetical protein
MRARFVTLEELMRLLNLAEVVDYYTWLTSLAESAWASYERKKPPSYPVGPYQEGIAKTQRLLELVKELELPVSARRVADCLKAVESAVQRGDMKYLDLQGACVLGAAGRELKNIFGVELESKHFFTLTPAEAALANPQEPLWGLEFANTFSGALYDLNEGAKCMAFGSSTAAVFHLMRVLESGLRATSKCLGIPDPTGGDRNWNNMLEGIKDEREARTKKTGGKSWAKPNDKEFFAEIYALLDAVRIAWRNKTAHIEAKYTEEETHRIYGAVKGFMSRISSRLDENGDPKA